MNKTIEIWETETCTTRHDVLDARCSYSTCITYRSLRPFPSLNIHKAGFLEQISINNTKLTPSVRGTRHAESTGRKKGKKKLFYFIFIPNHHFWMSIGFAKQGTKKYSPKDGRYFEEITKSDETHPKVERF
jgi:hypothetical protein